MKTFYILERMTVLDRFKVEAETEQEALEKVTFDPDNYMIVSMEYVDADPYEVYSTVPLAERMSLEEWRDTRQFNPYHANEDGAIYPALEYAGDLHIEIGAGFDYHLTIGNQQYVKRFNDFNALESFEELLYNWAVSEGIFTTT